MISLAVEGKVAFLLLDRGPVNAIDTGMLECLTTITKEIGASDTIAAIVVHASGRFFCGGADINMMAEADIDEAPVLLSAFASRFQQTLASFRRLAQPTVCAIDGAAIGGGLELALSCDIRVMGRSARCGFGEIKLGLLPAAGGTQLLSTIAGKAVARDLILTGRMIDGSEAARLGLVERVVEDGQALSLATEIAKDLSAHPIAALRAAKQCIALAESDAGFSAEIDHTEALHRNPDTRALIAAFVSSRRTANRTSQNEEKCHAV